MGSKRTRTPGVKLLKRGNTYVARWTDPATKRDKQQSLTLLGLTNAQQRHEWMLDQSRRLLEQKAELAKVLGTGRAQDIRVADAVADYLATYGNKNTASAKRAPLLAFSEWLSQKGRRSMLHVTRADLALYRDHVFSHANPHQHRTKVQHCAVVRCWWGLSLIHI